MISASHLTKKYRNKVAVNDISFNVADGKVTGFLGPNGAGKSTTMRLMLGLDLGEGSTTFDGKRLNQYDQPSKVVGILLDAKSFHPTRTARNHLRVLADSGNATDARVTEVLDIVGLRDVADKAPGKFSLGMSQRLGIAAAILHKPKYLLLDEPANGLDPEGIHWLRQFIRDYATDGNAVFVSSHLLSEMSLMADNLVVIGKGKVISDGSVDSFIQKAQSGSVFVQAKDVAALERALHKAKLRFEVAHKGLRVFASDPHKVGTLAFAAGTPVYELHAESVSLEEAFLQLTADAEEYGTPKGKK